MAIMAAGAIAGIAGGVFSAIGASEQAAAQQDMARA